MGYRGHIEGGSVVLDEPISLPDGTMVRIDPVVEGSADVLEMAREVYSGLSSEDVADIERLAFDRRHFFEGPSA